MKILVPVEDVFFGSAIASFLSRHQWPEHTEIRVITVVEPFILNHCSQVTFAEILERADEEVLEPARQLVKDVTQAIKTALPKAIVAHDVIEGQVKDAVISTAREWACDLIVAGSHGRSGFNRFLLGSVSLTLLSAAPCPVLLVKPDTKTLKLWDSIDLSAESAESIASSLIDASLEKAPRKILIAIDETELSEEIIDFVIRHDWVQPAHFKLLTVVRRPNWMEHIHSRDVSEGYADLLQVRRIALRTQALKLRDCYHSPNIEEELIEGNCKRTIIQRAKDWGADLIIVGSHLKGSVQRMFAGSVSLDTLCTAPCSILLIGQNQKRRVHSENHCGGIADAR